MVTMISVWCVSTPVWWPGEDAGEGRGLRNCCRVLLGLVTEPWPANDGRNDGANLSCIDHVSIMYLSWRYTQRRGGGGTTDPPTTSPGPHNVWSSLHLVALVAVRRCYEIHKYLLRKIVSIYIYLYYTAKSEVKSMWNIILLWIWSCCVYVNIFGDSQIDLSNYTINTFQQPKLILQFDGQIRSRSWQKVKIPG